MYRINNIGFVEKIKCVAKRLVDFPINRGNSKIIEFTNWLYV